MKTLRSFVLLVGLAAGFLAARAQTVPVIVQAESGVLGSGFTTGTDSGNQYVTAASDGAGNSPGVDSRVITFTVTFPAAGTYDLYARVKVGPGGLSDDSFFYGSGFGNKSSTTDSDWVMVDNLSSMGYSAASDVVLGGGTTGPQTWKWINLSEDYASKSPRTFTVSGGALTQSFQIGARENGLLIDKLAFASTGSFYTVANLDADTPGTSTPPGTVYVPPGPPLV